MGLSRPILVALLLGLLLRIFMFAAHAFLADSDWSMAFHRFDSYWYGTIATTGYPEVEDRTDLGWSDSTGVHQSDWAFFPLYPVTAWAVASVTGLSVLNAMEILSWVFAAAALFAFMGFARRMLPATEAGYAMLAFALFPFSVFLHVHYTEALFLAILLAAFNCLFDDRRWQAALLLALLVLVRPTGLLMLPAAVIYFHEQRAGPWQLRRLLLLLTPAAMSFGAYCLYQYVHTGEPLAFSIAQAGWGRSWSWPWSGFFNSGDIATQIESIYAMALILLAIGARKAMPLSFQVLLGINILVPLCSGSVDSITRFTLVLFPLFLVAGPWLAKLPVAGRIALGCVAFALQLVGAWLWVTGHPLMA